MLWIYGMLWFINYKYEYSVELRVPPSDFNKTTKYIFKIQNKIFYQHKKEKQVYHPTCFI